MIHIDINQTVKPSNFNNNILKNELHFKPNSYSVENDRKIINLPQKLKTYIEIIEK